MQGKIEAILELMKSTNKKSPGQIREVEYHSQMSFMQSRLIIHRRKVSGDIVISFSPAFTKGRVCESSPRLPPSRRADDHESRLLQRPACPGERLLLQPPLPASHGGHALQAVCLSPQVRAVASL